MDEFDLIRRFFSQVGVSRDDVLIGIGDDAAVVEVPAEHQLVIATDTLVEDVHFPASMPAEAVGHRALAVNLSDLAAMGAAPAWATLALTAPDADAAWLQGFAAGLDRLARAHEVALIGGDTTRGPRCITVTVHGFCGPQAALARSGANAGDVVCVTGVLGEAAAGLESFLAEGAEAALTRRFLYPVPRIGAGRALVGLASAAIDVSDGLLADLGHILEASGVGAQLELERLPLSAAAVERFGRERARDLALGGGDDYELCCCVPPGQLKAAVDAVAELGDVLTPIGEITAAEGLACVDAAGQPFTPARAGYQHFE